MGTDDNLPMGPPHLCEFKGVEHFEPDPKKSKFDFGPGWVWRWQCIEGPNKGRFGTRVTGKAPTPKSACGRMLSMLVGRPLEKDVEVDLDQYIGKRFLVTMEATESGGTRVSTFYAAEGGALPPPSQEAPPPPPNKANAKAPRYWIVLKAGQRPSLEKHADIEQWIKDNKADPTQFDLCAEGSQEWKPASEHGFTTTDVF
jgi:hypothetical protein